LIFFILGCCLKNLAIQKNFARLGKGTLAPQGAAAPSAHTPLHTSSVVGIISCQLPYVLHGYMWN